MPAPSFIRPVTVSSASPFLGDNCALCKEAFGTGDKLVICPQDGSRHHEACWQANGNHCTAFGCDGQGEVLPEGQRSRSRFAPAERNDQGLVGRSKVRTMPSSSMGCAQTCLVLTVALAILLIAAGCFGLWAVADYILIDVLGWQYRAPFSGSAIPAVWTMFMAMIPQLALL